MLNDCPEYFNGYKKPSGMRDQDVDSVCRVRRCEANTHGPVSALSRVKVKTVTETSSWIQDIAP